MCSQARRRLSAPGEAIAGQHRGAVTVRTFLKLTRLLILGMLNVRVALGLEPEELNHLTSQFDEQENSFSIQPLLFLFSNRLLKKSLAMYQQL